MLTLINLLPPSIIFLFFMKHDKPRMRDRNIMLDPYLDHGVLVRVCEEIGVPVGKLDPSPAPGRVSPYVSNCAEVVDV